MDRDRIKKFRALKDHFWLKKAYAKLTSEEIKIAEAFINQNETLTKGEFELAVNRMFLDINKPKNFTVILELLCCCNT